MNISKAEIIKAFRKPFTRCVEEVTLIANHRGEISNSKSEWHPAKVIRTSTLVVRRCGGGQGAGRRPRGGGGGKEEGWL